MESSKEIEGKILESLSLGRCPICALLRQDEFDYICEWVGVSDAKYRKAEKRISLVKSKGFCNYHFWEFENISRHDGSAEVCLELIEQLIIFLRGKKSETYKSHIICPVCSGLKEKQHEYLNALVSSLRTIENRKKYADGWGLCYPHLLKIFNYVKDTSLREFLLDTELEQLEKVKASAMELVRKKDSPLRWEQTDDEKVSYFRAIEKLVGRRGTLDG